MAESNMTMGAQWFSTRAGLAALGVRLRQVDLCGPVRQQVRIAQKRVKYAPSAKLYDASITILAGAHGLVEIDTRLRRDRALPHAFGRAGCAEQSVVRETLDACTAENVAQREAALDTTYRQHSRRSRHGDAVQWHALDVDMRGLPCGPKAARATKGDFATQRNRRGRQRGRVVASRYDEIVVDRLLDGKTQLNAALQPLVLAAEQALALDGAKRERTIVRVDAGGGSLDEVNWALRRGYRVHCQDYSAQRTRKLAAGVTEWREDPQVPGRQVGWVTAPAPAYAQPARRIAVRCRKQDGTWGYGVSISARAPDDVRALTGQGGAPAGDAAAVALAYLSFYDQRSGGCETVNTGSTQGLGVTKRNKKRFAAQQILIPLGALAYKVLSWARTWLTPRCPPLACYGMLRFVRAIGQISGFLLVDGAGRIGTVVLNHAAPLAAPLAAALATLLAEDGVAVTLGRTQVITR